MVPPELHHLFGGPTTGPAPASCEGFALVRLDAAAFRPLQRTAELAALVDALGVDSARAQGLGAPVTAFAKLRLSNDRVYVAVHQPAAEAAAPEPANSGGAPSRMAVGLLKVGEKDLFHWSRDGTLRELRQQRCVLDFYVAEAFQRRGLGKELFETMLAQEHCHPAALAYDRPSPKLLGFLAKHHALTKYVPQQNQFVLFDDGLTPPKRSAYDSVSMRPLTARGAPATRNR